MELADKITPSSGEEVPTESQDSYRMLFSSLRVKCDELEARLKVWYATLEAQNQHHHHGHLYYREPSTLYAQLPEWSPERNLPFQYFVCFPDPDIAQQVVLYWTGSLLMHSTLWLAKGRLQRAGFDVSLASSSPPSKAPTTVITPIAVPATSSPPRPMPPQGLLITQSLEYFVHPDMGFLGTNFIGFPMAVAQGMYQHFNAPELAWFDVIFERMRQMKSGINGFLDEMAHETGDAQLRLLTV